MLANENEARSVWKNELGQKLFRVVHLRGGSSWLRCSRAGASWARSTFDKKTHMFRNTCFAVFPSRHQATLFTMIYRPRVGPFFDVLIIFRLHAPPGPEVSHIRVLRLRGGSYMSHRCGLGAS